LPFFPTITLDAFVKGLDQVGGINAFPNGFEKRIKGQQVLVVLDGFCHFRIAALPFVTKSTACF